MLSSGLFVATTEEPRENIISQELSMLGADGYVDMHDSVEYLFLMGKSGHLDIELGLKLFFSMHQKNSGLSWCIYQVHRSQLTKRL